MVAVDHVDRTDRQLVVGVGELPSVLATAVQLPRTAGAFGHLAHTQCATAVVVLGAVHERNRAQGAEPEAGIAEQLLVVERHDHDGVRAGLLVRVADTAEPPLHGVAEPLERRREQRSVLEAIAAPPATDELRLDGVESDSRMLFEQHVDVVERERPHVRLEQPVEC